MRKSYEETKFIIGIPYASDFVPIKFLETMVALERPKNCEIIFVGHTITSAARNVLALKALKNKADYLFFIDSDMIIPPDTIYRLWEHDKMVVSGLYKPRRGDGAGYMSFEYDYNRGHFCAKSRIQLNIRLQETHGTGAGCLLINTEVFKRIEPPWFWYNDKLEANFDLQKHISESQDSSIDVDYEKNNYGYGIGEDLNFFFSCLKEKIPCYVDTTVFCGHLAVNSIGNPTMKIIKKG